jgi:RNA polymerase sigma-70 factor (ECF subfamily)
VVRREQAVLLADALEALPVDYREVIILRQLEELPFPEVARRMGRSVDSVKNLWVRSLARLRREVGEAP